MLVAKSMRENDILYTIKYDFIKVVDISVDLFSEFFSKMQTFS